jgi:hypothetical protein
MTESDIKLMLLNTTAMTVSMAHVETLLKVALLIVSIGYTAQRWWLLQVNKNNKNKK